MDIRQLEAFKLIVQTGTFMKAARKLGLTQSALSHQVRTLEAELGEQLLVRARPRTYPTTAGQRLLLFADRILDEVGELKAQFANTKGGSSIGTLRVAATNLAITYIFGDLLEKFAASHPEVDLIFHATENTEMPIQRVAQRESDIGFTAFPVEHPKLEAFHLVRMEQVFIVSPKHPLARQKLTTLEELRRWPFTRFELGTGGRQVSDALFVGNGGYPSILAESNDVEYLKRVVRIGTAVALVPVVCVHSELKNGSIVALRLKSGQVLQDGGFVRSADVSTRALQVFESVCRAQRGSKPKVVTLENAGGPIFV
jgi:DNA-binding transcriptional LysR family regulator